MKEESAVACGDAPAACHRRTALMEECFFSWNLAALPTAPE